MIYLCTVKPQMNTRHTFAKRLTDFTTTNSRQNIAAVSLHTHVSSTLDMWLGLVSYVSTLIKCRLYLIGLRHAISREFSNSSDLLTITTIYTWICMCSCTY